MGVMNVYKRLAELLAKWEQKELEKQEMLLYN